MIYNIRGLKRDDSKPLFYAFKRQGEKLDERVFLAYYSEQQKKERKVFIAEYEGEILGYATMIFTKKKEISKYTAIPELTDIFVFDKFRGHKIGSDLIKRCESEAYKFSDYLSVKMPILSKYGFVHKVFSNRGYYLDGSGIWSGQDLVENESEILADKDLHVYMVKRVKEMRRI